MTNIAEPIGTPEILEQTDNYTVLRLHFSDGSSSTKVEFVVPTPGMVLTERIDASLDRLRDGIASFDTDTAALRWATVKVALRVVLALARLARQRTEVDG